MNRRWSSRIQKSLKDYLAPIVIIAVFSLLLLNYLFSSPSEVKSPIWDNSFLTANLVDDASKAQIIYTKWDPADFLTWENKVYKTEKIKVSSWNVSIKLPNDWWLMTLDKLWDLRYIDTNSFILFSSNLWVQAKSKLSIDLKYLKVSSSSEAVYSLSQNDVASSIYVLDWVVEVKALNDTSTVLQKWEKMIVLRDFWNWKLDVSTLKQPIDDYIKNEDWFVKNNWAFFLEKTSASSLTWSLSWTWNLTSSGTSNLWFLSNSSDYIQFSNLYDEAQITTSTIDVEWQINSTDVAKILINNSEATIDNATQKFVYKNLKLNNKSNDVVYKIYDINNNLLKKWIVTVYFADWKEEVSWTLAKVDNYPISNSPLYQIISPKQNPYSTSEKVIRVEGTVPAWTVSSIVVNDFKLTKFPQFWTYWSYFANEEYGNLKDWVNLYKIQYLDAQWNLIHENTLTIIKQTDSTTPEVPEKIIY